MLGRKSYTPEEIDNARLVIDRQLQEYRSLAAAVADGPAAAPLAAFSEQFFNTMIIVLDRFFVHRVRPFAGKDSNPLNEVELLAESLMNNKGVLRVGTVIKYVPAQTVLGVQVGETIAPTATQFEALATAFFAELASRSD